MSQFEKGKVYTCLSSIGRLMFCPKDEPDTRLQITGYEDCEILIRDGISMYAYKPNILTFYHGADYTCVEAGKQLVFDGVECCPVTSVPTHRMKARKSLQNVLAKYAIQSFPNTDRTLCSMLWWHIDHEWDDTDDGMRKLIDDQLKRCFERYQGAIHGASLNAANRELLCRIFVPQDADVVIRLADNNSLPKGLFIKWVTGSTPRVLLPDGRTLWEWLRDEVRPVNEK